MFRDDSQQGSNIRDYGLVLWRRKWMILLSVLVATGIAVYLSQREAPVYEASADVLLRDDNLAGILTGVADSTTGTESVRVIQTKADLARVRPLLTRVIRTTGAPMTVDELLQQSSVSPKTNSDLLTFSVDDGDAALARRLATAYAREYTSFLRRLDTTAIRRARGELKGRLDELRASGDTRSALYASLDEKVQLLGSMAALQTSNAYVVDPADTAVQIAPRPVRNGLLAFVLGLVLGIGLAFLRDTLDTRIRSAAEIEARLGLPLLGRIPAPALKARRRQRLVALDEPNSTGAEAFRVLRTNLNFVNLDFVNPDRRAQMIMVTSAVADEGKSTIAANLAVTLARSGRRILLADLDARRPSLHAFFGLPSDVGLTRVALGHTTLEAALTHVPLAGAVEQVSAGRKDAWTGEVEGLLRVLPFGPIPPNPGEFVASDVLASILASLRDEADLVLIDAPPLLDIGDALVLSSKVDAMLVVTRLRTLRRPVLAELHRLLEASPAAKLGFVVAGAEREEGYGSNGYLYSYGPNEQWERQPVS